MRIIRENGRMEPRRNIIGGCTGSVWDSGCLIISLVIFPPHTAPMAEESTASRLTSLPPELIHAIALSGVLSHTDVTSLSLTCKTMVHVLVDDPYAHDLHMALKGVVESVQSCNWSAARYALSRGWYKEEETLWKRVLQVLMGRRGSLLAPPEEWEGLVVAALSLPCAAGYDEVWRVRRDERRTVTLAHVAAGVGCVRVMEWVRERGGDLGRRNNLGERPLWVACKNGHLEVVALLVEAGVRVEKGRKKNVLNVACHHGHAHVVEYLLGLGGFDLNVGHWFRRPLGAACLGGHMDVIHLLIARGATLDHEGSDSKGPLYLASSGGHVDVISFLLEAGVGPGPVWQDALEVAVESGHAQVVEVLLARGKRSVDVEKLNRESDTLLCSAARAGHVDVVRCLVTQGGADIDASGDQYQTPLCLASQWGYRDLVVLLLELGADPEKIGPRMRTPLEIALEQGHLHIAPLFPDGTP